MNPRDPLWHSPTRPRVANLIDELPDDFSDRAAEQQVQGYIRRLAEHGLKAGGSHLGYPAFCIDTHELRLLLRAVYLDGRADQEADTADDTHYRRVLRGD